MATSHERGGALLDCLKEVSELLECALSLSLRQRDALVANDAEEVMLTTRAHEEVLRRISESDQRAAALAAELSDGKSDVNSVPDLTGQPYSDLIQRELNEISDLAARVKQAGEVSRKLIANGLDIIVSCLRTVACDTGVSSYGSNGNMEEPEALILSLDRRA